MAARTATIVQWLIRTLTVPPRFTTRVASVAAFDIDPEGAHVTVIHARVERILQVEDLHLEVAVDVLGVRSGCPRASARQQAPAPAPLSVCELGAEWRSGAGPALACATYEHSSGASIPMP